VKKISLLVVDELFKLYISTQQHI